MNAPIVLFTYARVNHTQQTVEALLRNIGACEHEFIVYSDAPRTPDKARDVAAVRDYLQNITGFRSVTVHHRPHNYGLAKSIIDGVTEVLSRFDRIIVLEDDMVTSPHFLSYMNEALERFEDNELVISVHGYVYPTTQVLPEAFFLRGADCWGWATWRRGWALFNSHGKDLLDQLKRRNLLNAFDFNGAYPYSKMLESQIKGENDSWAIRWYASAFLANKLTLYPGRSLVQNIGNDDSGTHCGATSIFDIEISHVAVKLDGLLVEESEVSRNAVEIFFRSKISQNNHFFNKMLSTCLLHIFSKVLKYFLPAYFYKWLRNILNN